MAELRDVLIMTVARSFSGSVAICCVLPVFWWRHVFTQWTPCRVTCIPKRQPKLYRFQPYLLNDQDQRVFIVRPCAPTEVNLLATIALFMLKLKRALQYLLQCFVTQLCHDLFTNFQTYRPTCITYNIGFFSLAPCGECI